MKAMTPQHQVAAEDNDAVATRASIRLDFLHDTGPIGSWTLL